MDLIGTLDKLIEATKTKRSYIIVPTEVNAKELADALGSTFIKSGGFPKGGSTRGTTKEDFMVVIPKGKMSEAQRHARNIVAKGAWKLWKVK